MNESIGKEKNGNKFSFTSKNVFEIGSSLSAEIQKKFYAIERKQEETDGDYEYRIWQVNYELEWMIQ
jgi:hypothetical protein